MKLGLSPSVRYDIATFGAADLQRIKELGFSGAAVGFTEDFADFSKEECTKVKTTFEAAGLGLPELGQYQRNYIHPDESMRKENISGMQRSLERAKWMGCPVVITGSGSLNPKNQWFDHKDNHSWRSFDLLVQGIREVAKAAEDLDIIVGLECHTYTALDSPETALRVVEAVGSPAVKVDLDPVNWITYATYWRNAPFLHAMFDLLQGHILGGHAKDVRQEEGLIVHLNESYCGDGNLDYQVYLQRMAQLPADSYLVVEHTPFEHVPKALAYIREQAAKAGVSFGS